MILILFVMTGMEDLHFFIVVKRLQRVDNMISCPPKSKTTVILAWGIEKLYGRKLMLDTPHNVSKFVVNTCDAITIG